LRTDSIVRDVKWSVIHKAFKDSKFTIPQIAYHLNLPEKSIERYKTRKDGDPARLITILRICNRFNISIDDVISQNQSVYNNQTIISSKAFKSKNK
jgi:hypothetical protein